MGREKHACRIDRMRAEVKRRLAAKRDGSPSGSGPAPRYDSVYFEGTAWLDAQARVPPVFSWSAQPWQECEAGEHGLCDVIFAPNGSVCPCPCHLRGEVS